MPSSDDQAGRKERRLKAVGEAAFSHLLTATLQHNEKRRCPKQTSRGGYSGRFGSGSKRVRSASRRNARDITSTPTTHDSQRACEQCTSALLAVVGCSVHGSASKRNARGMTIEQTRIEGHPRESGACTTGNDPPSLRHISQISSPMYRVFHVRVIERV